MNTFMGTDVNIRYAEQVVTPEVNKSVVECIGELKKFQDRSTSRTQSRQRCVAAWFSA